MMSSMCNEICRTCLGNGGEMKDLYTVRDVNGDSPSLPLHQMLLISIQIQATSNDGLPGQICLQCVEKLHSSYEFKELCLGSEATLKNKLLSINNTTAKKGQGDDFDLNDASVVKLEPSVVDDDLGDGAVDDSVEFDNIFDNKDSDSIIKLKPSHRLARKKRKFQCSTCSRKFSNMTEYNNHYCDKVRFRCTECKKSYGSAIKLERHTQKSHNKDLSNTFQSSDLTSFVPKMIDTDYIGDPRDIFNIKQENLVDDHIRESYNPSGDVIHENKSKITIEVDESIKKETRKKIYKLKGNYSCKLCPVHCFSNTHLLNHMARVHSVGKKVYGCGACNETFSKKSLCARHRERMHSDLAKTFICHHCERVFNKRETITRHIKKAHTLRPKFKCRKCGYRKRFYTKEELENHVKENVHDKPPINFVCEECNKGFVQKRHLEKHVKLMHMKLENMSIECYQCKKTFNTRYLLKLHARIHNKSLQTLCPICGVGFKTTQSLRNHIKRHKGDKQHKCQYCDKAFVRLWDKKVHEKHHTDEKSYSCTVCGKCFVRPWSVTTHMRVHTGEKPFKCTYCDWSCNQSNDLKLHIRRHTGERFNCDMCSESFIQGYLLKNHKLSAHGIFEPKLSPRVKKVNVPKEK